MTSSSYGTLIVKIVSLFGVCLELLANNILSIAAATRKKLLDLLLF